MVEKPMALTLKDADEMINACRSNNIKLFIIKQNRFNTPVVALRKALEKGRFGKLFMGTVRVSGVGLKNIMIKILGEELGLKMVEC